MASEVDRLTLWIPHSGNPVDEVQGDRIATGPWLRSVHGGGSHGMRGEAEDG